MKKYAKIAKNQPLPICVSTHQYMFISSLHHDVILRSSSSPTHQLTPVTTYKLYTYNPLLSLRTNCTHTIHSCHYVQTVHIQSTPVTTYKLYTYNPLLSLRTNCTHTIHSCHYVQTVHIQSTPVTTYKLYTYNPLLSLRTNCTHTIMCTVKTTTSHPFPRTYTSHC